jgi:hypothetical protein
MALCPNCQAHQPDGGLFCDNCGAKLSAPQAVAIPRTAVMDAAHTSVEAVCPQCSTPLPPGTQFCTSCGAAPATGSGVAAGATMFASYTPSAAGPVVPMAPVGAAAGACSNCGSALQPGSSFCDMCGAPVSASASSDLTVMQPPSVQPSYTPIAPVQDQVPAHPSYPPGGSTQVQPAYAPVPLYPALQPGGAPSYAGAMGGRLVVQQSGAQLAFPSGKTEHVVGREDPASNNFPEIDLNDHGGDEGGVSRRHARLSSSGGQFYVEDLGSVNGTFVNRQKLAPNQRQPLSEGDEIQFGKVKVTFHR